MPVPARRGAILSLAAGRRGNLILTGSGSCVLCGRLPSSGWAAGVVTAKPITTHHQVCDYSRDQQRHGHGDAHSAPSRPPPSPPPRRIPWSIREIQQVELSFLGHQRCRAPYYKRRFEGPTLRAGFLDCPGEPPEQGRARLRPWVVPIVKQVAVVFVSAGIRLDPPHHCCAPGNRGRRHSQELG